MNLEYVGAPPQRRRLIDNESNDLRAFVASKGSTRAKRLLPLRPDIKTRIAQFAIAFDVSLSPFEGYTLIASEASSFLWERPHLMKLLPEVRAQINTYFPLAMLRLEKSPPSEIGELAQVLIICVTHLDALSAFDARRDFLSNYWSRLPSEIRNELGFHLEFRED